MQAVDVQIVNFPETKVAALEHRGPPHLEHETARRLIEWRLENHLHPDKHRSYGVHYTDPRTTAAADHRVDFCISVDHDIPSNAHGVVSKVIPGGRCAVVWHFGSRANVSAAFYLYDVWLPKSGEMVRDFPVFFHYVNVGPYVRDHEMITDVYLPLR
jgi:AraC family transcriptional regulator